MQPAKTSTPLQDTQNRKEQVKPIPTDVSIGRLTRMDAIGLKSTAEASLRNAEQLLIKLKNALTYIDNPNFGICTFCGNQIPIQRILAIPEVTVCVNCVSKNRF